MKILHIEDTPSITNVFSKICTIKKHDYLPENDSHKGLDLIISENFDLIFLDLFMPKLSGYDILDRLKEKKFDTSKIIILTAATLSDDQVEELKKHGIKEIVYKPISLEKILELIENKPIVQQV